MISACEQLSDQYTISYTSSVSKKGWTVFNIRKLGNRGFVAAYSVPEKRFANGKCYLQLPQPIKDAATQFAQTLLPQ